MGVAKRVVVFVQENHTTDNYFRGLAPWGANVETTWTLRPDPPPQPPFSAYYPPHHRKAYFDWLTNGTAEQSQFDTAADLPYYLFLAVTGAFAQYHCSAFGTNSTPNHLALVGGQSPTLTNPPRRLPPPLWDMPSVPGLAEDHGVSWRCYAASRHYPVGFYEQLNGSPNVVPSSQFIAHAQAGDLPSLVYVWHDSPYDEHSPASIKDGMDLIWQCVDAAVQGGAWEETVFMLTWDDWGGFDDHVSTPATEYTPDNVQVAFGPRVPLLIFGGHVKPGIDSRWSSHVSVPKTAIDLLELPPLGVPRVDNAASFADLVVGNVENAAPPGHGAAIDIPEPPVKPPQATPPQPSPVEKPEPIGEIILRGGKTLPPPNDAPLPQQEEPPGG
jgi:Phosphoesterase family